MSAGNRSIEAVTEDQITEQSATEPKRLIALSGERQFVLPRLLVVVKSSGKLRLSRPFGLQQLKACKSRQLECCRATAHANPFAPMRLERIEQMRSSIGSA